jgi:hypothetical protein
VNLRCNYEYELARFYRTGELVILETRYEEDRDKARRLDEALPKPQKNMEIVQPQTWLSISCTDRCEGSVYFPQQFFTFQIPGPVVGKWNTIFRQQVQLAVALRPRPVLFALFAEEAATMLEVMLEVMTRGGGGKGQRAQKDSYATAARLPTANKDRNQF